MRRAGEESDHAGEGVHGRRRAEAGQRRPHGHTESLAQHRAEEQRRREDAADGAGADRQRRERRGAARGGPVRGRRSTGRSKSAAIASRPLPTTSGKASVVTPRARPAIAMATGRGSRGAPERGGARARATRKAAATRPPRRPSSAYSATSQGLAITSLGHAEDGIAAERGPCEDGATAEETARGANASRAKLPKRISIVKSAAPSGVL